LFEEIGIKIDRAILNFKKWNHKRFWYKVYGYFQIKNMITNNEFKDSGHFIRFMSTLIRSKRLENWQAKRLIKKYEEAFEKEVDKYIRKREG